MDKHIEVVPKCRTIHRSQNCLLTWQMDSVVFIVPEFAVFSEKKQ